VIPGNQPIVVAAAAYAFRVGFVATPKPGCGWCWCCCSLLGETSRKLYTYTCTRAHARTRSLHTYIARTSEPTHRHVRAHAHTNSHPHRVSTTYASAREHTHTHVYTTSRIHAHEWRGQREKLTHVLSRTLWRVVENVDNEKPPLWSFSLSFSLSLSLSLSLFLSLCHSPCSPLIPLSLHRFLLARSYMCASPRSSFSPLQLAPGQGISLLHQKSRKIKKKNTNERTLETAALS